MNGFFVDVNMQQKICTYKTHALSHPFMRPYTLYFVVNWELCYCQHASEFKEAFPEEIVIQRNFAWIGVRAPKQEDQNDLFNGGRIK